MTTSRPSWEHMSESNEHFTPPEIVDAGRETMGGRIVLDPASNAVANSVVRADRFHSIDDPGHNKVWRARTAFLNPPGGLTDNDWVTVLKKTQTRESCTVTGACGLPPGHSHKNVTSSAKRWWQKLAGCWKEQYVDEAIFVGFSLEMLQTFQVDNPAALPLPHDFQICFPRARLAYYKLVGDKLVEGSSPPHASFIVHLHSRMSPTVSQRKFQEVFGKFGVVR